MIHSLLWNNTRTGCVIQETECVAVVNYLLPAKERTELLQLLHARAVAETEAATSPLETIRDHLKAKLVAITCSRCLCFTAQPKPKQEPRLTWDTFFNVRMLLGCSASAGMSLVQMLLNYQLKVHLRFLAPLSVAFRQVDKTNQGTLDEPQFIALARILDVNQAMTIQVRRR